MPTFGERVKAQAQAGLEWISSASALSLNSQLRAVCSKLIEEGGWQASPLTARTAGEDTDSSSGGGHGQLFTGSNLGLLLDVAG